MMMALRMLEKKPPELRIWRSAKRLLTTVGLTRERNSLKVLKTQTEVAQTQI
jgi:hypothetical protein